MKKGYGRVGMRVDEKKRVSIQYYNSCEHVEPENLAYISVHETTRRTTGRDKEREKTW